MKLSIAGAIRSDFLASSNKMVIMRQTTLTKDDKFQLISLRFMLFYPGRLLSVSGCEIAWMGRSDLAYTSMSITRVLERNPRHFYLGSSGSKGSFGIGCRTLESSNLKVEHSRYDRG